MIETLFLMIVNGLVDLVALGRIGFGNEVKS
jgi:hypothetical protein